MTPVALVRIPEGDVEGMEYTGANVMDVADYYFSGLDI